MNCEYWREIVKKLRTDSNWVAHILSTCIDEKESNLSQALKCVSSQEIVENTIYGYEDWSAQSYCDEILYQFEKSEIVEVFQRIENPSENILKGFHRFLDL